MYSKLIKKSLLLKKQFQIEPLVVSKVEEVYSTRLFNLN